MLAVDEARRIEELDGVKQAWAWQYVPARCNECHGPMLLGPVSSITIRAPDASALAD
jgi:hypothetical protein